MSSRQAGRFRHLIIAVCLAAVGAPLVLLVVDVLPPIVCPTVPVRVCP